MARKSRKREIQNSKYSKYSIFAFLGGWTLWLFIFPVAKFIVALNLTLTGLFYIVPFLWVFGMLCFPFGLMLGIYGAVRREKWFLPGIFLNGIMIMLIAYVLLNSGSRQFFHLFI